MEEMGKATTSNCSGWIQNMGRLVAGTSPIERFIKGIEIDNKTGCWNWVRKLRDGYACFKINGKSISVHIWAYKKFRGPIGTGLLCCHTCDNRRCVNPWHIFLGSNKDNTWDAMKKGRMKSIKGYFLKSEIVFLLREMHKEGNTAWQLSQELKIDYKVVNNVLLGKTYRFLDAQSGTKTNINPATKAGNGFI